MEEGWNQRYDDYLTPSEEASTSSQSLAGIKHINLAIMKITGKLLKKLKI